MYVNIFLSIKTYAKNKRIYMDKNIISNITTTIMCNNYCEKYQSVQFKNINTYPQHIKITMCTIIPKNIPLVTSFTEPDYRAIVKQNPWAINHMQESVLTKEILYDAVINTHSLFSKLTARLKNMLPHKFYVNLIANNIFYFEDVPYGYVNEGLVKVFLSSATKDNFYYILKINKIIERYNIFVDIFEIINNAPILIQLLDVNNIDYEKYILKEIRVLDYKKIHILRNEQLTNDLLEKYGIKTVVKYLGHLCHIKHKKIIKMILCEVDCLDTVMLAVRHLIVFDKIAIRLTQKFGLVWLDIWSKKKRIILHNYNYWEKLCKTFPQYPKLEQYMIENATIGDISLRKLCDETNYDKIKYILNKKPDLIKYINRHYYDLCFLALEQNGLLLEHIIVKTPELCVVACINNINAVTFVDNPLCINKVVEIFPELMGDNSNNNNDNKNNDNNSDYMNNKAYDIYNTDIYCARCKNINCNVFCEQCMYLIHNPSDLLFLKCDKHNSSLCMISDGSDCTI